MGALIMIFILTSLILPFFYSIKLDDRLMEKHKKEQIRHYRWGYYSAIMMGIVFPISYMLIAISSASSLSSYDNYGSPAPILFAIFLFISGLMMVLAKGIYDRKRDHWVVTIILQLLFLHESGQSLQSRPDTAGSSTAVTIILLFVVFNIYYVWTRWAEFASVDWSDSTNTTEQQKPEKIVKMSPY